MGPSLLVRALAPPRSDGILSALERRHAHLTRYGSGKAALRDGLAAIADGSGSVLLPAYLPDGVAEPLYELDLEPRYYRIRPDLGPDLADLERRLDDGTVAAVSVDYFGFPQPRLAGFASLLADRDCYHVDDNAHAPLSVADGTLLGTRGDLGITSLRKLFAVPDGALLYCSGDAVRERFEPSAIAGVRERFDGSDWLFLAKAVATGALESNVRLRRSAETLLASRRDGSAPPSASARYEAGKRPMSKLSVRLLEAADPDAIRAERRTRYREWLRFLSAREGLQLLRPELSAGICPQAVPVRTSAPERLLDDLEAAGVAGAHTWPRLAGPVRTDPAYATARRLAEEVVVVPIRRRPEAAGLEAR